MAIEPLVRISVTYRIGGKKISKFQKGTSGNPGGNRKGTRYRKTLIRRELDAALSKDDLKQILCALIQKAKNGDFHAARLILSYRWGSPVVSVDSDLTVHTADSARDELLRTFNLTYIPSVAESTESETG